MKSINQIAQDIIDNALATSQEELENQFDFFAAEEGYSGEEIEKAKSRAWFPRFKNPAAVALGRIGGGKTSGAKKKSSAENGRAGGRPKKTQPTSR